MTEIDYVALAVASFIFAITPGPGILAVLAISINRSSAHGVAMSVGEVCADMAYLLLAMISLASLSASLADFLYFVRIIGAGYIGWMGIRQMMQPPVTAGQVPVTTGGVIGAFATGVMISITNPKVILFYLLFLPVFIDLSAITVSQRGNGDGGDVHQRPCRTTAGGAIGRRARDIATGEVSGRWLNRITGMMLIGVAVAMILMN